MKGVFALLVLFSPLWGWAQQFDSGEQKVHLLELYSSQGCSSCPPAQNWVNRFSRSGKLWKDVVPVVFHVDYWDYLGWTDPFASAAFSQRQRQFKQKGLSASVYTPGFVFDGREWRGWFKRKPLLLPPQAAPRLTAELGSGKLSANIDALKGPLVLNIALLGMEMKTKVTRGENARRTLEESFVVLDFKQTTSLKGQWRDIPLPSTDDEQKLALALWVTAQYELEPIQATGGWLKSAP